MTAVSKKETKDLICREVISNNIKNLIDDYFRNETQEGWVTEWIWKWEERNSYKESKTA